MSLLIVYAMLMGFTFCLPPGPVMAVAIRNGLQFGYWAVFLVEIGSLVGDSVFAVLGLSGSNVALRSPAVAPVLEAVGIMVLAYYGFHSIRSEPIDLTLSQSGMARTFRLRDTLVPGAILSLANPNAILFWLGLGGTIGSMFGHSPSTIVLITFFSFFMLSCVIYCFLISAVITKFRSLLTARVAQALSRLCGLIMIALAMYLCASWLYRF